MDTRASIKSLLLLGLVLVGVGLALTSNNPLEASLDVKSSGQDELLDLTARSSDKFVDSIGVNTHLDNNLANNTFDSILLGKINSAGIRHVREALLDYNYYRQRLKQMSDSGIKLDLVVERSPTTPTRLPSIDATTALVNTYIAQGVRINSIELPNEYNHPRLVWNNLPPPSDWPKWLVEFSRDFSIRIKNNPSTLNIPVVAPTIINYSAVPLLEQAGPIKNYVDYGNVHWYCHFLFDDNAPGLGNLCNLDSDLANFGRPYASKPMMITETGIATSANIASEPAQFRSKLLSETVASKYQSRRLLELFNRGIARTYLYELYIRPDTEPTSMSYYFGLIDKNGREKPAFTAIKNMISLTKDAGADNTPGKLKYRLQGPSTLRQTLLQKRNGQFLLWLWNEVDSTQAVSSQGATVTFNQSVMDLKTYNPLTSTNIVAEASAVGQVEIQVADSPVLIALTPSTAPPSTGGSTTINPGGGSVHSDQGGTIMIDQNGAVVQDSSGRTTAAKVTRPSSGQSGQITSEDYNLFILPAVLHPNIPRQALLASQAFGVAVLIVGTVMLLANLVRLVLVIRRMIVK
jgi:hypothetical protein